MKGDSVCWGEDWKALRSGMSCDTLRGRETQEDREREREQLNSFTKCPLVHVKSPCVCECVCTPTVCVCVSCVVMCVILKGEVI